MGKSRFIVLNQCSSNMCLMGSFTNPQTIHYLLFLFCFISLNIRNSESKQMPHHYLARAQDQTAGSNTKRPSHVTSMLSLFLSPSQNRPPSRALASLGKCAFTCGINMSIFIEPYLLRKRTQSKKNMGIRTNSKYNPHCPAFLGKANNLVFYSSHI